jgi:hypothetical protein
VKLSWLATHRSSAATAVGSVALVALVAAISVNAPRHDAPPTPVGDGGVWVTNGDAEAVGRVNAELAEFNSVVQTSSSAPDVAQNGRWVVSVDDSAHTATRIDAATAKAIGSVTLPSAGSGVVLVGQDAVVYSGDDGRMWSVPVEQLSLFDTHDPELKLGAGAIVSTTPAGGILALSPTDHQLYRAEPGVPLARATRTPVALADPPTTASVGDKRAKTADPDPDADSDADPDAVPALQLAATSGTGWAVLDDAAQTLITANGPIDLSGYLDPLPADVAAGPVPHRHAALQRTTLAGVVTDGSVDPGPASVFVATDTALLEVDLKSKTVQVVSTGHQGTPARPIWVAGCEFAAWADGSAWKRCGDYAPVTSDSLQSMDSGARLVYRNNGNRVLLNDPASGNVWAVQTDNRLIDDWAGAPRLLDPNADKLDGSDTEAIDWSLHPQAGFYDTLPGGSGSPMAGLHDLAQGGKPAQGDSGSAEPAKATPVVPPPPPSSPPGDPATAPPIPPDPGGDSASTIPPVATAATATLDEATGTVTVAWSPFGDGGSPLLGYFAESLGASGTALSGAACTVSASGQVTPPAAGEVRATGLWTTASFDGITEPGAEYGFAVWGYNRNGCVATSVVTVTPTPPPGPVTAVVGSMIDSGTEYEYRIDSVTPRAPRYEVQRLDAGGAPVGDVAGFSDLGALPRTLTDGPFGVPYAFQLRACNEGEGACGPWSAPQASPSPSLTFALAGLHYSADTGEWTWDALPDNGGLSSRARCSTFSGDGGASTFFSASCVTDVPVPAADAWLRVSVGAEFRDFTGDDFAG